MKDVERRLWRVLQGKPNERQLMLDEWAAEMQQAPWSFVSQKEDEGKEMAPEWGTLMASLPDRLSQTEGFFSASVYTTFWAHEIWNTSLSDNARWPLHSASLVHHLLKRGHGETLCNAWTRNLIESDRKENNVQIILRSLDSASIESLLVLFIKSLQRARQTKDVTSVYKAANLLCTLIPSSNTLEDIDIGKEILVDRLLLGRLLSESPDTLHLLIHCIKLLDPSTLAHTLSRTIESWAHSYILEKQALTSQLNYSRVLLLLTGHAPRPLLMEFKIPLIQGVSMYLDQPNKETRNMGMV